MSHFDEQKLFSFFRKALSNGNLYRTLLLVGASDESLRKLARKTASLFLCNDPNMAPCGKCGSCCKNLAESHPDVIVVERQDRKNILIEQIRDVIYESTIKPWEGKYKIFILYGIDSLREEAANALLKTLEEPSDQCIFLMTAENENAILETILSRCQTFPVILKEGVIEGLLEKGIPLEKAQVAEMFAEGNFEKAFEMVEEHWEMRHSLFHSIFGKHDAIEMGEEMASECGSGEAGREKARTMLLYLASFWHDILLCKYLPSASIPRFIINRDFQSSIEKISQRCSIPGLHRYMQLLFEGKGMLESNVTLGLIWENLFLAMDEISS